MAKIEAQFINRKIRDLIEQGYGVFLRDDCAHTSTQYGHLEHGEKQSIYWCETCKRYYISEHVRKFSNIIVHIKYK